jgi:hypothetical protein
MSTVKTEQKLLTNAWIDDVGRVVTQIRGFAPRRGVPNGCRVVLFELAGDRDLHVNVTHEHHTTSPAGWAGPGIIPDGFVHNRRFDCTQSKQIARHIQTMICAPRHRAAGSSRSHPQ